MLPERHPRDFVGSRHARRLVTIFLGLRPTLRFGLRVADGFGQHLAELSLGLRRRARCFLPLGHGQYVGMRAGELNPWMRHYSVSAAVLRPLLTGEAHIILAPRLPEYARKLPLSKEMARSLQNIGSGQLKISTMVPMRIPDMSEDGTRRG
jgi:hypothetical protein